MSHIWMSHVTHMNESCHTHGWVMSHIWMSHVPHMNESCHTHGWVMSHIWMNHISLMNDSCHVYQWFISHMWILYLNYIKWVCMHVQLGGGVNALYRNLFLESWYIRTYIYTHTHTLTHTHAGTHICMCVCVCVRVCVSVLCLCVRLSVSLSTHVWVCRCVWGFSERLVICCSVLQCIVVYCSVYRVLQCIAVYCSVLQCVAVCWNLFQWYRALLQKSPDKLRNLQLDATQQCNTLVSPLFFCKKKQQQFREPTFRYHTMCVCVCVCVCARAHVCLGCGAAIASTLTHFFRERALEIKIGFLKEP